MSGGSPYGTDWTDAEIDLIVADYFEMLGLELAGRPYVKKKRNEALQALTGRTHRSIEFKHQNISAVLRTLGFPWIRGYRPAENFQRALINGIDRFLTATHGTPPMLNDVSGMAEEAGLFIEPPPAASEGGTPAKPLLHLMRKFDPAARDARNRLLGHQGEERIFRFERQSLLDAGRDDLARQVRWVSQEDGDGAGYDIRSFTPGGSERLLEVKTTTGHRTTPFFLTENERALSDERHDAFRLIRLYDFARTPRAFELQPPLDAFVNLTPTVYRASFSGFAGT